ncbi:MAG: MerR family transcriptional regulator [Bacillota bacterium]|nr:MerR family transcriptional regulator [Bacillota bacterium]
MEKTPDRDRPLYPMSVASELTGLTPRQIRYYDQRGLVSPHRTQGGHRLFSARDLERLLAVKRYLGQGYTLREIRRILEASSGEV